MVAKNRKWLLGILPILVLGLLLAACAPANEDAEPTAAEPFVTDEAGGEVIGEEEEEPLAADETEVPEMTEEADITDEMADVTPFVTVSDQDLTDSTVVIDSVVAATPGWIVIHADDNGQPGAVIGQAAVNEGENTGVEVEIDQTAATDTLYAMLHEDTGTAGTYEFPDADAPVQDADGNVVVQPFTVQMAGAEAGTDQMAAEGNWLTSGELIGLPVVTQDDEQIAEVSEVLIDEEGAIHFVIFDAGGFLGIEERVTAVDWDVLQMRTMQDAATTGMTDDAEATAEAEDTDATDEDDTDTATGEDAAAMQQGRSLVYISAEDELDTEPEVDAALFDGNNLYVDAAQLAVDAEESRLIRVSQFDSFDLLDYDLLNEAGDDLGEIEQLLFNIQEGQVVYAIADVGGFLGIGENAIAIPWALFEIDQDAEVFILPVQQETLTDAPTIDLGTLDDEGFEEGWDEDFEAYWQGVS